MKSLSRAFQGYAKGPAVVDPEFDASAAQFKRSLQATDNLVNHLQNFNKTVASMKNNMAQVIKTVVDHSPQGTTSREVALDAQNVLGQFVIQSDNLDRALTILQDYQKLQHQVQQLLRERKEQKDEYEHYTGKARDLEKSQERDRYKRALDKSEFYGVKLASATQECETKMKVILDLQDDIFTRALVGFIDAQGHNQVVAPCQNFVEMYRTHTEDPWPDVQDALHNAKSNKAAPAQQEFDDWAPEPSPVSSPGYGRTAAAAAATSSPSASRSALSKPSVPMVRALYDFTPSRDDELPMRAGDFVVIVQEIDQDWALGRCAGKEGLFPISYTERL